MVCADAPQLEVLNTLKTERSAENSCYKLEPGHTPVRGGLTWGRRRTLIQENMFLLWF